MVLIAPTCVLASTPGAVRRARPRPSFCTRPAGRLCPPSLVLLCRVLLLHSCLHQPFPYAYSQAWGFRTSDCNVCVSANPGPPVAIRCAIDPRPDRGRKSVSRVLLYLFASHWPAGHDRNSLLICLQFAPCCLLSKPAL